MELDGNVRNKNETGRRIHLQSTGFVSAGGKFEVLAITEGEGNGWNFSRQALQGSLALWEGVECFVDHGPGYTANPHSVRDLGGMCEAPRWSDEYRGVMVTLNTFGPSACIIGELGRELLKEGRSKPRVGFSADVAFTANKREVLKILKVYSLDLVVNPARGGAFVRALNSIQNGGIKDMEQVETGRETSQESPGDRILVATQLLENRLAASGLPWPAADFVRREFQGRAFEPGELNASIEATRKLISALTGPVAVTGPRRVSEVFNEADQLQAAVDDLLGAPRDTDKTHLKVHRLSGIREAYHLLTGDFDFHGGFYPERARLATTSDFTGLVKNALNKIVANQWEILGRAGYDWWTKITTAEHFNSLQSITGTLVGTVGTLPAVAEGAEYTELVIGDSPETATFTKYGGYIPLTLELIDRDETRKLAAYPRELAKAGLRKISALVAAIFTDNSGTGPTLADGGALFNATAVTTAGGHANLLTTALSASQWDVVMTAVFNQPMLIKNATGYYGSGPKLAVNPRFCLVPRALELTAKKILYPTWAYEQNYHYENQQQGASGDVVVVPEWSDANDWAAVVDPAIVPGIFVGERFGIMPEVFIAGDELSPAVFTNDEHRLKVRHFLAVWVNDFRPLHKSNV